MATLSLTERIAKLEDMLASGLKSSSYANGVRVEFQDMDALRRELDRLKSEQARAAGTAPRMTFARFRGD